MRTFLKILSLCLLLAGLLHNILCTIVCFMSDERAWFSEVTHQNVTAVQIAKILNVSRNTATTRLKEGLTSDELITVSRALGISPIHALVELGKITYDEAFDFLDGDGQLLQTASPEQLVYRLAEDMLNSSAKIELGAHAKALVDKHESTINELEQRRSKNSNNGDFVVHPETYAANNRSPEPEEGDDDFNDGA